MWPPGLRQGLRRLRRMHPPHPAAPPPHSPQTSLRAPDPDTERAFRRAGLVPQAPGCLSCSRRGSATTSAAVDLILAACDASDVPLTVVEIDRAASVSSALVQIGNASHIREVVVCGASASMLPSGVSEWKTPCRTPAQLCTLRRALLKAASRVAIVATTPLSAAHTLRCVQLYLSLPSASWPA